MVKIKLKKVFNPENGRVTAACTLQGGYAR